MNNELIDSLILARMKAWQHFQPLRFAEDNINFKTPLDGMWYRLTVQHGINLMAGMADEPITRELGAAVIQIFYPNNTRTESTKRLADSLGDHFGYYRIETLELMTPSVINVPQRENGYQINVRIPFRFDSQAQGQTLPDNDIQIADSISGFIDAFNTASN